MLRLAVSSSGALHEPTLSFLDKCGLSVSRTDVRKYTAEIPNLPDITIHFQRGSDIPMNVESGNSDMGIVGEDRFIESSNENSNTEIVIQDLGFGHAELLLGIPDSWIDISTIADLADLSIDFREKKTDLRIATKYPKSVENFLLKSGINHFNIIPSSGTLEIAPTMGYADLIADISSTGNTLRSNRLKTIQGGTILKSSSCLISNSSIIRSDKKKLNAAIGLIETIEANLNASSYLSVTANLKGDSPDSVSKLVLSEKLTSGIQGPTISQVYSKDSSCWYAVTVIVKKKELISALQRFRKLNASSLSVSKPYYIFENKSKAVEKLLGNSK
ncbi:MAG: ATP phosphoribosyltransferase [Chloroflexi bacterium]|nr:ATP phosphoribosyltransferase [Chloroflexota bacterium]